jgi:hypothetical protein
MDLRHLLALGAILLAIPAGAAFAARSRALRDVCAFLLVLGTTRFDLLAVTFESRPWYRGTTRGFEICWLDLLALSLLAGTRAARGPARRLPPSLLPLLGVLAVDAVNVAALSPHIFGLFELSKVLRAILIFLAVARYVEGERELGVLSGGLSAAVLYEVGSSCWARFALHHPRAEGTLDHANSLSMYLLIAVPVLLAVSLSDAPPRLRRMAGLGAALGPVAVLFTISRAGIVILGPLLLGVGVTCGSLRVTPRKVGYALLTLAVGGAALGKTWSAIDQRFAQEGGYAREYEGARYEGRGAYLATLELIEAERPFGVGLNNWSYWVNNRYGPMNQQYYAPYPSVDTAPPRRPRLRPRAHVDDPHAPPAHSLYAITMGETGWPGVLALGALWLRWGQVTGSFLRRRSPALLSRFGVGVFFGLGGAFAQSFTEWEIRQTPLLFLLHILLGAAAAVHPARPALRAGR